MILKTMIKKLIEFLTSLKLFNKNGTNKVNLPIYVDNPEKIVKVIFSPLNVKSDRKSIKSNAYRGPAGKDEVSVMRQDYCSPTFCKQHGKKIQAPKEKKAYFGFGLLTAEKIRNVGANVEYTPEEHNDFHADIKIGYIPEKGQELPAEYKYKVDEMTNASKIYPDPNPDSNEWEGEDLIY